MSVRRLGVLLAGALALSAISGCGEDVGSEAFAGTQRAVGPGKAYSFRFLAPPWAPLSTTAGVYGVVDWDVALNLDLTKLPSLESLPVVLRVEAVTPSADAALFARMATLSPPLPASQAATLGTRTGIHGREVSWRDDSVSPPLYWREGYFDGSALGTATYRMQFRAHRPIADDPLILAMMVSFGSGNTP